MYFYKFYIFVNNSSPWKYFPMIIVNNIDKFNVSWFRNTHAHCLRTCERSEQSDWRCVQIHNFWKTHVNSRYLGIFVNEKTKYMSTHNMNNPCNMFESNIVHILLTTFHLWVIFSMENSFPEFLFFAFRWNLNFCQQFSTKVPIIWIENIFIVNKIDNFNVSGFRNTQAHLQRISKSREPFDLRHVQIHDFFYLNM